MRALKILSVCLLTLPSSVNAEMQSQCSEYVSPREVSVTIEPSSILRTSVPREIYGFDLPWYDFQLGHFRNGSIRPETLEYLSPFKGAVYRFSGGNIYEWSKTLGTIASRKKIRAYGAGYTMPYFGLQEISDFVERVNGKFIMMLNPVGPDGVLVSESAMITDNILLVDWFKNRFNCVDGDSCRLLYWELGNELDWPSFSYSIDQYLARTFPLVQALKVKYPTIQILSTGKTTPWDNPTYTAEFNNRVAEKLAAAVSGVAFHAYYDGYSISDMYKWMDKTIQPYLNINPKVKMVATEHGRWPSQTSENWSDDWYKASGSKGALGAADFVLAGYFNTNTVAAAWHGLGVKGPWQLFHWNIGTDAIYPSATYWGMRVIRHGLLDDLVQTTPALISGTLYAGKYDVRFAAMKDAENHLSLSGINRSNDALKIAINLSDETLVKVDSSIYLSYLATDERGSDNTDDEPEKFKEIDKEISSSNLFPSIVCVPPRSVFSIYPK